MTHPPETPGAARFAAMAQAPGPHAAASILGPRMTTLVASCALVLTGKAMGLEWLASPILGLPSGLWAVGMAMLFAQYRHQRRLEELGQGEAGGMLGSRIEMPPMSMTMLRERLPTAEQVAGLMEMVGVPAESWENAKKRVSGISTKLLPGTQPTIRIGVDLCEADREALFRAGSAEGALLGCETPIEWVRAPSGLVADAERDLSGLDALVRRERRGDINIFIPESTDRPAAWHDWATAMPLGYASVFPPRIDAARVTLSGCDLNDEEAALAAARMTLACAMLGRTPMRTGGRRLLGRTELPRLGKAGGPIDTLMMRLGDALRAMDGFAGGRDSTPGYVRTAARVVGAWVTRSECGLAEGHRAELAASAGRWVGDEPEAVLRAAAMRFAVGDMEEGNRMLREACMDLRARGRRCESDPLAFIMSEVELGEPGRTTLGRIAAGIGLLWATSPEANMAYLSDDLMDDLGHAGWLADRAGDVQMLQGVVDGLQRAFSGGAGMAGMRRVA